MSHVKEIGHNQDFLRIEVDPAYLQYGYYNPNKNTMILPAHEKMFVLKEQERQQLQLEPIQKFIQKEVEGNMVLMMSSLTVNEVQFMVGGNAFCARTGKTTTSIFFQVDALCEPEPGTRKLGI